MSDGPTFEGYLASKKIDSEAFRQAEPEVWESWKSDFQHMHANSFTVHKLNLINPIRRKYHLATPEEPKPVKSTVPPPPSAGVPAPAVPRPGRPVIRPKTS